MLLWWAGECEWGKERMVVASYVKEKYEARTALSAGLAMVKALNSNTKLCRNLQNAKFRLLDK
jgi:hypothetical protein